MKKCKHGKWEEFWSVSGFIIISLILLFFGMGFLMWVGDFWSKVFP